jgi:hypothetical protein
MHVPQPILDCPSVFSLPRYVACSEGYCMARGFKALIDGWVWSRSGYGYVAQFQDYDPAWQVSQAANQWTIDFLQKEPISGCLANMYNCLGVAVCSPVTLERQIESIL